MKTSKFTQAVQYAKMLFERDLEQTKFISEVEEMVQSILARVSMKYPLAHADYYALKNQVESWVKLAKQDEDLEFENIKNIELEKMKARALAYSYATQLYIEGKSSDEVKQELIQILKQNVKLSDMEINNIVQSTIEAIETLRRGSI
jgi:hypothetical protein